MVDFNNVGELLDYRNLGDMYEQHGRRPSGNDLFEFYNVPGQNYDTDEVEFIRLGTIREPAPLNQRGAPAHVLQPEGKDGRKLSLLHQFNMLPISRDSLTNLRHPEMWELDRRGIKEIEQQAEDMAIRHQLTKQVWMSKHFLDQTIYIKTATGQILESSSGADISYATLLPTQNIGQIPGSGFGITGDIIDAAWDVAGTKILTQLDKLRAAAQYQGSEPPRHIWINSQNKFWLRQNTELLAFYSGIEMLNRALEGDTFQINNYTFHFTNATYINASGTRSYYVPLTRAIITPDIGDWLATGNGVEYVPTTIDINGTPMGAVNDEQPVYGPFGFSKRNHNPNQLEMFWGDNWLWAFRNSESVFAPTVDF